MQQPSRRESYLYNLEVICFNSPLSPDPFREQTIREQQGGFRPGRGCVEQIFTLRQYMEHRHTYHRATIYVFLDLKAAFVSVDRLELFNLFLTQGVPAKYVNILKSMYAHTSGKIRAYGQLSRTFNTTSRSSSRFVPYHPFFLNFVIDEILNRTVDQPIICGINVLLKTRNFVLTWNTQTISSVHLITFQGVSSQFQWSKCCYQEDKD